MNFDEIMATKKGNLLQTPMGFRTAFTGVREDWALCSYSMYISMYLRVALFLHSLLRVEPFSFPSPPTSTTMDFIVTIAVDALRQL